MPQIFRPKLIGTLDYSSTQRKTIELDRDGILSRLLINVRYTLTGAASAATAPMFQTLARIMRRVEVKVGGRDTIVNASGEMLSAMAHYDYGAPADGMDDSVVLTENAATSYDVTIPIDFTLPRARRPDDTGLDLRRVTQADLAITWANSDATDLFTTNPATISAVTCSLHGEYMLPDQAGAGTLVGVRQLTEIEKDIPATSSNFKVTIDGRTGLVVRRAAVAVLDDKIGDAAIMDTNNGTIKLESGSFVFRHEESRVVKAKNRLDLGLESTIAGYYDLPFINHGELVQAINTSNDVLPADLELILDVTKEAGTNTCLVLVEAVRAPKFPV